MSEVFFISKPIESEISRMISESDNIDIMVPSIDQKLATEIIDATVNVKVVTRFKHPLFACNESSLSAIEYLFSKGADIRSTENIHSKTFIFDDKAIVVSSITSPTGFNEKIEYGFLVESPQSVKKIKNDFEHLFSKGIKVSKQRIEIARRMLKSLVPKRQIIFLEVLGRETQMTPPGRELLVDSLGGWMKEVFAIIESLPDPYFRLEDIYSFESTFSKRYPRNFNIDAKIRQTLQYLRDLGLIEFVDYQGTYRRT